MVPQVLAAGSVVAIIGKATTAIITYFTAKTLARVALIAAAVAAITTLSIAFANLISSLASSAVASMPSDTLSFFNAVVPSNLAFCVSLIITAESAKWLYLKNMEVIAWIIK